MVMTISLIIQSVLLVLNQVNSQTADNNITIKQNSSESDSPVRLSRSYESYKGAPFEPNMPKKVMDELIAEYKTGRDNEDIHLNITQLTEKYGFDTETHQVQTQDGYIITMFRIRKGGPPVLLMHGLLSSADDWLTAGRRSALGYLLADAGYDVWLGNARGNKHSRRHARLSPDADAARFWDFSWDEIGRYDLPAKIDYILNTTHQFQLFYVGHSQGTTSFFVMCSMRPEYNAKIKLMVALSPVVYMNHIPSPPIRFAAWRLSLVHSIAKNIGLYEFMPDKNFLFSKLNASCYDGELGDLKCNNVLFMVGGFNYAQINASNLHVVMSHTLAGSATKQLIHYGQEVASGYFRRFDYEEDNIKKYGSTSPPEYPLDNCNAPIASFYGDGDWLASVVDVKRLHKKLRNIAYIGFLTNNFNHLDFLWAKDVKKLLYDKVLQLFNDRS